MKTKAAVVHEDGAPFKIEEVELAAPLQGEILVKVAACGICHTDEAARSGEIPIPKPLVLGHEGAGVVQAVGEGVTEFAVGDHVALSYGSCGECKPCKQGTPYACDNMPRILFGGRMEDGSTRISLADGTTVGSFFAQSSFASHCVVNARNAVKLDPTFDLALAAPLGCGLQTGAGIVLNCLKLQAQDSVTVFGCGSVGFAAIMAARIAGCENIIAVGGNPRSLELALEVGATHAINRKEVSDVAEAILDIVPSGVDAVVETSGNSTLVKAALKATTYLGRIVVAAACDLQLNTGLELGARSIIGVTEGYSIPKVFIPQLIEYYKQGLFPIDKLVTRFAFEDINEAFESSHGPGCIKAVLVMD